MSKKQKKKNPALPSKRSVGLRLLRNLDQVWIELLLTGNDARKKFTVRDTSGVVLFFGGERLEKFTGRGRGRRFHMTLLTTDMQELLNIYRKEVSMCCSCFCYWSCMEQVKVTSSLKDRLVGTIDQRVRILPGEIMDIKNSKGSLELRLKQKACNCCQCCGYWNVNFDVLNPMKNVIGNLRQERSSGFAHNFSLRFSSLLEDKLKAMLIVAVFVISSRNFEMRRSGYEPEKDSTRAKTPTLSVIQRTYIEDPKAVKILPPGAAGMWDAA